MVIGASAVEFNDIYTAVVERCLEDAMKMSKNGSESRHISHV